MPELRARRRRAVAAAILSHPHPDHYGGLGVGLDAVRLGALWDTGEGEQIVCLQCGLRYPVRDGIPVMLVEEAEGP